MKAKKPTSKKTTQAKKTTLAALREGFTRRAIALRRRRERYRIRQAKRQARHITEATKSAIRKKAK